MPRPPSVSAAAAVSAPEQITEQEDVTDKTHQVDLKQWIFHVEPNSESALLVVTWSVKYHDDTLSFCWNASLRVAHADRTVGALFPVQPSHPDNFMTLLYSTYVSSVCVRVHVQPCAGMFLIPHFLAARVFTRPHLGLIR